MNLTSAPAGPPEATGCPRCEGEGWITEGGLARACPDCGGDGMVYAQGANSSAKANEGGNLCDCERSHNGIGLAGRECDCPAGVLSKEPTHG